MRNGWCGGVAGLMLLACASGLEAQRPEPELTIEAPPALASAADRVRNVDRRALAEELTHAGLDVPPSVRVTLIPEDDSRARATPGWIVGLMAGPHDIAIFPARAGSYPDGSLESVVWHEVVHVALAAQAGDGELPRWFHEGVAMSVEDQWGVSSDARLLFATVGNPAVADLGRLFASETEPQTASAYLLAAALVSDIRQRHGAAAPGAIADRVARGAPFAEAFEAQTGETPDEAAARAWHRYRRWIVWIPILTSGSALWIGILALAFVAFLATLRKRARRRRQWDETHVDA